MSKLPCPHCYAWTPSVHHLKDVGPLHPDTAKLLGYCPVLAERRYGKAGVLV